VATRTKSRRKVRQHEPTKPPLTPPLPPGANTEPPVPNEVELQAQRLVHRVGSVEGAKEVIDTAARKEEVGDFRQDAFAMRFGFASRRELLAASKPLFDCDRSSWWATELKNGQWIVWGDEDLSAKQLFASLEEAEQAVGAT
jgi:hypothetical protein